MKKLLLVEKMAKYANMKRLQQQVTTLQTQQQKRSNRVAERQAKVEKVTSIIQPVNQKL